MPLGAVHVGNEGRVGSQEHDIRITLHAGHERRLAQRRRQIAVSSVTGSHRVFANKHVRPAAAVTVILRRVRNERRWIRIIMLVLNLHRHCGRNAAPVRNDQVHRGVIRLNGAIEKRVAIIVIRAAIFVANFEVFQVERSGVAVGRPQRAPVSVGVAVAVFNQVQGILHPGPHLIERHGIVGVAVVAETKSRVDPVERFHAQVFAEQKELVQAEAVGGPIAPGVVQVPGPQRQVAHGLFPSHRVGQIPTFNEIAAWVAKKRRPQSRQQTGQVGPQAVGAIMECSIGKERNDR